MNYLKKWLLIAGLVLATQSVMASNKAQLYGNWKGVSGSSIQIIFKENMRYVYRYKMITFTGRWSASENNLTFHYSVLGSKHKKQASFSLRKGFLTLHSHEHSTVVLRKRHKR